MQPELVRRDLGVLSPYSCNRAHTVTTRSASLPRARPRELPQSRR